MYGEMVQMYDQFGWPSSDSNAGDNGVADSPTATTAKPLDGEKERY